MLGTLVQNARALQHRLGKVRVHAVLQSARILNECPEHQEYFRALGRYFERLRSWN